MQRPHRKVVEVVMTAQSNVGDRYEFVRFDDDSFGIRLNEEVVREHWWPGARADDGVETFVRISGYARE